MGGCSRRPPESSCVHVTFTDAVKWLVSRQRQFEITEEQEAGRPTADQLFCQNVPPAMERVPLHFLTSCVQFQASCQRRKPVAANSHKQLEKVRQFCPGSSKPASQSRNLQRQPLMKVGSSPRLVVLMEGSRRGQGADAEVTPRAQPLMGLCFLAGAPTGSLHGGSCC